MGFIEAREVEISREIPYETELRVRFNMGRIFDCQIWIKENEMDLNKWFDKNEFEYDFSEFITRYIEGELKKEKERMSINKFKEVANLLGVKYSKRFQTDGYGDYRIDYNGVYSYEDKKYDNEALILFLRGIIKPVKEEESCNTK